jgi:hypothetical protein
VLVFAGVFVGLRGSGSKTPGDPAPAAPAQAPSSVVGAPATVAASAPASSTIFIVSVPPGAEVTENGSTLGHTPLTLTIDPTQAAHTPRVLALGLAGHEPNTLTIGAVANGTVLQRTLDPLPVEIVRPNRPAAPARPRPAGGGTGSGAGPATKPNPDLDIRTTR